MRNFNQIDIEMWEATKKFILRAYGPTQPPVQWVTDLFPGGKPAEAWRLPSTLSCA
jgi:hypothetical protein